MPKVKAEIVVSSIPVQTVVDAARSVLYTGHMGDGKIFIYNVENVVRISSGEQDPEALSYEDINKDETRFESHFFSLFD